MNGYNKNALIWRNLSIVRLTIFIVILIFNIFSVNSYSIASSDRWWDNVYVSSFSTPWANVIATGWPEPTSKHTEEYYLNLYNRLGVSVSNWADIRYVDKWYSAYEKYVNIALDEKFKVIGTVSMITTYQGPEVDYSQELSDAAIIDPFGNILYDRSLEDSENIDVSFISHSFFHPNWKNYLLSHMKSMVDIGVDGILIDELAYSSVFRPDFNPNTMSLFRNYLFSVYNSLEINEFSNEYKIDDFNNFNYSIFIKEYLPVGMNDITDENWNWEIYSKIPFGYDFEKFKRVTNREISIDIINQLRSYALDTYNKKISISSNINDLSAPEAFNIIDLLDYTENEIFYSENSYFPNYRAFSVQKLLQAFKKKGNFLTSLKTRSDIIDKGKHLTKNLYRTMIADAYASGGNFTVEEGFWGIEMDVESLDEYFNFPIINSKLFDNSTILEGKVGILFLWECLEIYESSSYRGLSNLLSDIGYQFNVIFGSQEMDIPFIGNIYPSPNYPLTDDALDKYDCIIIPNLLNIIDSHASVILDYIERGGNLIVFTTQDSLNNIDQQWSNSNNVFQLMNYINNPELISSNGTIILVKDIIGKKYLINHSSDYRKQMKSILAALGIDPEIEFSQDRHVLSSNLYGNSNKLVANFVNYNHNSLTDQTTPSQPVNISIQLPENFIDEELLIDFFEPGKDTVRIDDFIFNGNHINFVLPEIFIWGILSISLPCYSQADLEVAYKAGYAEGASFDTPNLSVTSISKLNNDLYKIKGTVTTDNGIPLCTLVLANGQFIFTCDGNGSFDLEVPLDSNNEISLYSFSDGMMPYLKKFSLFETNDCYVKSDIDSYYNDGFNSGIGAKVNTPIVNILDINEINNGWYQLRGNVQNEIGAPLCTLVLANGQNQFTCDGSGSFDLTVPTDASLSIKLYCFANGMQPYKKSIFP